MTTTADRESEVNTNTTTSRSSVPSIALQITRKTGDRFIEACEVLKDCVAIQFPPSLDDTGSQPLHERIFAAASTNQCRIHPLISQFLDRMQMSVLSDKEKRVGTLLFHESDKSVKLRYFFTVLSTDKDKILDRSGLMSLFRTILTAITSAIHSSDHRHENNCNRDVIVEGQPSKSNSPERPNKKTKLQHGDGTVTTHDETEDDESRLPCQSPSWDSSLATLRDEDDHSALSKDIMGIATYATDSLLKFDAASKKSSTTPKESHNNDAKSIDFGTFSRWYNEDGGTIVPWIELLQHSKWKAPTKNTQTTYQQKSNHVATTTADITNDDSSPGSLTTEDDTSRTLVSFDFTGLGSPTQMLVTISEDNLHALRELVQRTQLMHRPASEVCKLLLQGGSIRSNRSGKESLVLRKDEFRRVVQSLIPDHVFSQFKPDDREAFIQSLEDFFSWFEGGNSALQVGEVDLKEFAVGFCFFCSGNKSSKLSTGFELLDSEHRGYLKEDQLLRYLQSYLTMLVGMSLLRPLKKQHSRRLVSVKKRTAMRSAIENGAKWTLGHFLRASGKTKNEYTFENFASWYSEGGYNTAPWLELLDLNKIMSLIGETSSPVAMPTLDTADTFQTTERRPRIRDRVSSLRRHHLSRNGPPPEILFTFPLGNRRSLVVLKDDATYVRAVVEKLGVLSMKPDDLWSALSSAVEKRRPPSLQAEIAIYVSMDTFVQSMQDICPRASRKRPNSNSALHSISSTVEELLANFYQCFDIDQCDSVALDELMGGLTLLCGGKKSHKLAFAFSIFDTRQGVHGPGKKQSIVHSLSGEDLFLFLRSILIVTFSTCRQSLDLTDEMVGRCIADTANMICNDVMRHQWETKRLDRLDFDEFGQWYNDGGYERAPWLELLDLRKWVLLDDFLHDDIQPPHRNHRERQGPPVSSHHNHLKPPPIATVLSRELPILPDVLAIPPPPPEDSLDANFFDTDALMPMDSVRAYRSCCFLFFFKVC
jgi:Ca2+-binding EF-hand superfamily protein